MKEKLKTPHNGKNPCHFKKMKVISLLSKTPLNKNFQQFDTESIKTASSSQETPQPRELSAPMLKNSQRCTDQNILLKEQIQDVGAEIEAVKQFMTEQLCLLKKSLKDKHCDEESNNENTKLIQLLPC